MTLLWNDDFAEHNVKILCLLKNFLKKTDQYMNFSDV